MKKKKKKKLLSKVLDYVYTTSKQPILLKDMLIASVQFSNGMEVDSSRLGFRLRLTRAYIVLFVSFSYYYSNFYFNPISLLANIDSHISIIGGMIITASILWDLIILWIY